MISLLLLIPAIASYSISQLQQHNKLRWQNEAENYFGFWGRNSWVRKYKREGNKTAIFKVAPLRWYYKVLNIKYLERWPTSTWLTVAATDGYHASQSLSFIFMALSLSSFSGINFFWFWPAIPAVHAIFYRIFQR
jgi:hypothetical protein